MHKFREHRNIDPRGSCALLQHLGVLKKATMTRASKKEKDEAPAEASGSSQVEETSAGSVDVEASAPVTVILSVLFCLPLQTLNVSMTTPIAVLQIANCVQTSDITLV